MGRVTKATPTKGTKVITAVTKIKVIKIIKVTKGTKVITAVTKTKVLVTRVLVGVTKGKIPVGVNTTHPRGGPNLSSGSAGHDQGINDYDVDSSDILNLPDIASFISHVDTLPTLIQDEYLYDPFILPSNHLNVTVSVQDKDKDKDKNKDKQTSV
jgi:hypothetical protein